MKTTGTYKVIGTKDNAKVMKRAGTGKFFYFVSQVIAVIMGVFAYGLWELFK